MDYYFAARYVNDIVSKLLHFKGITLEEPSPALPVDQGNKICRPALGERCLPFDQLNDFETFPQDQSGAFLGIRKILREAVALRRLAKELEPSLVPV